MFDRTPTNRLEWQSDTDEAALESSRRTVLTHLDLKGAKPQPTTTRPSDNCSPYRRCAAASPIALTGARFAGGVRSIAFLVFRVHRGSCGCHLNKPIVVIVLGCVCNSRGRCFTSGELAHSLSRWDIEATLRTPRGSAVHTCTTRRRLRASGDCESGWSGVAQTLRELTASQLTYAGSKFGSAGARTAHTVASAASPLVSFIFAFSRHPAAVDRSKQRQFIAMRIASSLDEASSCYSFFVTGTMQCRCNCYAILVAFLERYYYVLTYVCVSTRNHRMIFGRMYSVEFAWLVCWFVRSFDERCAGRADARCPGDCWPPG